MGHPWGISGPSFLLLYGAVLAVAVVLVAILYRAVRRPYGAKPEPDGDVNILAYLCGGASRVVETSLAQLIEQGRCASPEQA